MCLQLFRPELEALTKSVTYVLFVFSRNRPQKRKRTFFSVWRLNRSFESVCLPCWLESCWSRSLLLSCSSPAFWTPTVTKMLVCIVVVWRAAHPVADGGFALSTHTFTGNTCTHTFWCLNTPTQTHTDTHTDSLVFSSNLSLWLLTHTHTHMWAHTAPWGRCPASTLRPRSSRPPRLWGVFGFVFGGSGCQPGVRQLGKPHHAD